MLTGNNIKQITDEDVKKLNQLKDVKELDLRHNRISDISKQMQQLENVEHIWLGENPFHCDCRMTWMITWLNGHKNSSGKSIVMDFQNVKCNNGRFSGLPIHLISDVLLGCYPSRWTRAQIDGVTVAAALVCVVFSLTVFGLKKSREVKFLMYYYLRLDTVPKDDKNENLDNIENDAYLCYW